MTEVQKIKLTGNYYLYEGVTPVNNIPAPLNQEPKETTLIVKFHKEPTLNQTFIDLYYENAPTPFYSTNKTITFQAENDATGHFNLKPELSILSKEQYRGDLIIIPKASSIRFINRLTLEKYLYGVVPNEVSASWPVNAIKAQILAARTYAYSNINSNSDEFDLYPDQRSQVYRGLSSEFSTVNSLVEQTAGEVITYNGNTISALFHSSNGGYIESNNTIYGTSELPYFKPKKDDYDDEAAQLMRERGISSYNVIRWSTVYTSQELRDQLVKNGYDVGEVKEVKITKTAATGRAIEVTVTGEKGSKVLKYDGTIRKALGLNSSRFTIAVSEKKYVPKFIPLNSTDQQTVSVITGDGETIEIDKNDLNIVGADGVAMENGGAGYTIIEEIPQKFTFTGKGWGHGLGMSQWGAWAMAQQTDQHEPFDYKDIIKYYYTGVAITKKY